MHEHHGVYVLHDEDEQVLYVGISLRVGERMSSHRADKDWWGDVATIKLHHVESRDEARKLERELIKLHDPPYNIVHGLTTDEERKRARYRRTAQKAAVTRARKAEARKRQAEVDEAYWKTLPLRRALCAIVAQAGRPEGLDPAWAYEVARSAAGLEPTLPPRFVGSNVLTFRPRPDNDPEPIAA